MRRILRPIPGIVFAGIACVVVATGCGGDPTGDPLTVTVPSGASLGTVADTLEARGMIEWPPLFRAYVRLRGADTALQAGRYSLRRGEAWREIVDRLTGGHSLADRMTIPEGFTLRLMAPRIAAISAEPTDSVRAALQDDSAHVRYDVPGPGLEGYLFPDTYSFAPGTRVSEVIATMTSRYRAFWTPERRARLDSLGMTEREVVTLASIVQAEARVIDEMPLIAGVYKNRIDRRHPLQADPTVIYALGGPRERLLYAAIDSVADSPYNTYTQSGLPPGPISAPGEKALEAALAPVDTDFFYFVARPSGEHVFTRTLAEHNRAKAAARREWDEARSAVGTPGPDEGVDEDSVETGGPDGSSFP